MPSISQKIRNVFSWKSSNTYTFDEDDDNHYKKVIIRYIVHFKCLEQIFVMEKTLRKL